MNKCAGRVFFPALLGGLWACVCAVLPACTQKMAMQGRDSIELLRTPPEGTVAREQPLEAPRQPEKITQALLTRGRQRYDIYCAPCHGLVGEGNGIVPSRGFLAPPSYHTERLRAATDQRFYDVITQGSGAMYSYSDRLEPLDRWAVVAYIRALQLSQNPDNGGFR